MLYIGQTGPVHCQNSKAVLSQQTLTHLLGPTSQHMDPKQVLTCKVETEQHLSLPAEHELAFRMGVLATQCGSLQLQ